jgi:hypothetical protein
MSFRGEVMTKRAEKVLQECQSWPPEEREELAALLYETLDSETDADYEVAWSAEIAERLREFDEGLVQGIPAEEVHRGAQEILDANRAPPARPN